MVWITEDDLARLLYAAEAADDFTKCEHCGAWMFLDEPGTSTVAADFMGRIDGCWWSVTMRDVDKVTCFGSRRGGDPLKCVPPDECLEGGPHKGA